MGLLIGTSDGIFVAGESGGPSPAEGLGGRSIRHISCVNGVYLAGADDGIYASRDGGRSWQRCGAAGLMVWDIAPTPGDPRTLYAVTQPAALFRSDDGGETWSEVTSFQQAPDAERWCLPGNPPTKARARTIVFDRGDPARLRIGVEVGGVVASDDGGTTWTLTQPGGNPDIHVMVSHPAEPGVLFTSTGFGRIDDSEPRERRIAGMFRSDDGGVTWRYLWRDMRPPYTRPLCIDPRPPYALTVACAPTAFSSHKDEGGAHAMLYQSTDGGQTWRSLGDADHSPSPANFHGLTTDPAEPGGVIVGTDTGEVWRVSPETRWTLLASGLPVVQAVLPA